MFLSSTLTLNPWSKPLASRPDLMVEPPNHLIPLPEQLWTARADDLLPALPSDAVVWPPYGDTPYVEHYTPLLAPRTVVPRLRAPPPEPPG